MNDIIVIGFVNETKTFELPKDIIQSYPNSILSLYEASETNENIIIEDMTYEQFRIVHSVITKKTKQWLVPPDILKFMDKYGLVDDALLALQNKINIKTNEKLLVFDNFLNGNELLLSVKSVRRYEEYKIIIENNKNIIPVQVTYREGNILCINIFDSIPIYCFGDQSIGETYVIDDNLYEIENIPINNEMDINLLRYHILLEKIKCKKCIRCDTCITLNIISMKCCNPCIDCLKIPPNTMYYDIPCVSQNGIDEHFGKKYTKYSGDNDINNTIYTKNTSHYLSLIASLLENIETGLCAFNVIKSDESNIIYWNEITPPIFTNNIAKSLKKIIDIFMEYDGDKIYNIDEDNYDNITTCYGFININNLLK